DEITPAADMSQNSSCRWCLVIDAALVAVVRAYVAAAPEVESSAVTWYRAVSALMYPAMLRAAGEDAMRTRVTVVGSANTDSAFRLPTCHVYAPTRVIRLRKSVTVPDPESCGSDRYRPVEDRDGLVHCRPLVMAWSIGSFWFHVV